MKQFETKSYIHLLEESFPGIKKIEVLLQSLSEKPFSGLKIAVQVIGCEIASKIPSLEQILDHFPFPIENIYFYFSPDLFTQKALAEPYLYDHGQLMIHGSKLCAHPFMVSPLSRC